MRQGKKKRTRVWMPVFLETLRKTCVVKLAASAAGVDRATVYYRARNNNPEFAEQFDDAIDDAVDMLAVEARRRALCIKREERCNCAVVGQEIEYSDNLLMFLLKAHRPEMCRHTYDLE